jgi:hypothetical protein
MRAPLPGFSSDSFWYIYNAEHDWEALTRSSAASLDMTVQHLAAKVRAMSVAITLLVQRKAEHWKALLCSTNA